VTAVKIRYNSDTRFYPLTCMSKTNSSHGQLLQE